MTESFDTKAPKSHSPLHPWYELLLFFRPVCTYVTECRKICFPASYSIIIGFIDPRISLIWMPSIRYCTSEAIQNSENALVLVNIPLHCCRWAACHNTWTSKPNEWLMVSRPSSAEASITTPFPSIPPPPILRIGILDRLQLSLLRNLKSLLESKLQHS
jgi:hypothetical protein